MFFNLKLAKIYPFANAYKRKLLFINVYHPAKFGGMLQFCAVQLIKKSINN